MTIVHSCRYELCQSLLLQSGGVQIVEPFGPGECGSQWLGHDEITDAESRKDSPRKCPDVDYASCRIQALERLQQPPFVVALAVVVIFDDHRILAARPFRGSMRRASGRSPVGN